MAESQDGEPPRFLPLPLRVNEILWLDVVEDFHEEFAGLPFCHWEIVEHIVATFHSAAPRNIALVVVGDKGEQISD